MQIDNKVILVTGGTGSIGHQVTRSLLQRGAKVIVYSRDQNKQYYMNNEIASKRVIYRNGDICDTQILFRTMKDVDAVIHCAALKHLPICETNPDNAIKVNIEGTRNVLVAALQRGVKKCLILSTDKAVYPTSVMGVTKLLAERLCLEFNGHLSCAIVRLGNVFASSGSVVPTFQDRIKNNLPININDPEAMRYFITKKEAGEFIVESLISMSGGEIFIKKMKYLKILQLAEIMRPTVEYPITISEALPGEKRLESLFTSEEEKSLENLKDSYVLYPSRKTFNGYSTIDEPQQFTNQEVSDMLKGVK